MQGPRRRLAGPRVAWLGSSLDRPCRRAFRPVRTGVPACCPLRSALSAVTASLLAASAAPGPGGGADAGVAAAPAVHGACALRHRPDIAGVAVPCDLSTLMAFGETPAGDRTGALAAPTAEQTHAVSLTFKPSAFIGGLAVGEGNPHEKRTRVPSQKGLPANGVAPVPSRRRGGRVRPARSEPTARHTAGACTDRIRWHRRRPRANVSPE